MGGGAPELRDAHSENRVKGRRRPDWLRCPRRDAHTLGRSLRCTPETDATSHTKRTSIKKNTSDGSKLKTYRHGQIPTPTA